MAPPRPHTRVFLEHASRAKEFSVGPDLEAALGQAVEAGEAAWPAFRVLPERFVEHLAKRVAPPKAGGWATAVRELRHDELYLTLACLERKAAALGALETVLTKESALALRRFNSRPAQVEELQQTLRERLLVGPSGTAGKLADFSGKGPLATWIRSVTVRLALNELDKNKREVVMEPEVWERWPATADDPGELKVLRARFRTQFKAAFEQAFARLSAEERNLLRLHLLDGVNIDKLAVITGAHRATAARRIVRAKEMLVTETRRLLAQTLRSSGQEVDELMDLVRSQLDLSIRRYLLDDA